MVFVPRRVDFRSRMAGHETKLMIPCPAIGLFVGAAPVLCALLMDMSLGFAPDMCGGDDPGMGDLADAEVCEFLGLM